MLVIIFQFHFPHLSINLEMLPINYLLIEFFHMFTLHTINQVIGMLSY